MVVTGGPDGAIPQSPAVRRRNGFAEACSVRCGAGASPATPTACEPRSGGSAASSATPPTNPPTSSTSTASATACRTRATGRRRSPRSDKLDPGRVVLGRNAHDAFAGSSSHANRLAEILLAHIVAIFRPCLPQLWPSADERSEVVTKNPDELRRRVEALEERGSKLCGAVGLVSASLDVDTIQQEVLDTPAGPREGGDVDVFV